MQNDKGVNRKRKYVSNLLRSILQRLLRDSKDRCYKCSIFSTAFSEQKKTGRFFSVGRFVLRLPPVIQLYVRILVSCRRLPILPCGILDFCNTLLEFVQSRSPIYIRQNVARNIPDAVYIGNINRFWSGQNVVRQEKDKCV